MSVPWINLPPSQAPLKPSRIFEYCFEVAMRGEILREDSIQTDYMLTNAMKVFPPPTCIFYCYLTYIGVRD